VWYSYAIIRVVPRIERGERVNVGVVLFARQLGFLEAHVALDHDRLRALAQDVDVALVERHLRAFQAISAGVAGGGAIAALPASERFHWLTAPRSTVIQTSPVHVGCGDDPAATLADLMERLVRPLPR